MSFKNQTISHYQNFMDQLNPKGEPTAKLVYHNTHPKSTQIGILDASFNPMTKAHEALIDTSKEKLNLDAMIVMLSGANVDKKIEGATLGQRLAMLVHYAQHQEDLSVAICSHARFIDKMKALAPCFSEQTQFYFIVGYDTLIRIFDPKYYHNMQADLQDLFKTCHFIASNRGPNDQRALDTFLSQDHVSSFAEYIHTITLPPQMATISSTQVRNNCQSNAAITHLVPPPILQAIQAQNLYTL